MIKIINFSTFFSATFQAAWVSEILSLNDMVINHQMKVPEFTERQKCNCGLLLLVGLWFIENKKGFKKRKMVEYSPFFWKSSVKTVKNLFIYFYLTFVIFTHMYIPHRRSRWIDNYLSLWDLLKIFLFRVLVNEIIWTGWVLAVSHLMVCPYLELINSR